MFLKWIFLAALVSIAEAQYWSAPTCSLPHIANGRVRGRHNRRMIRFSCYPGYEMVGSRYATCRGGEWDEPAPVCVRPGCSSIFVQNSVTSPSRDDAWVTIFCLPGFRLKGSPALFCDGMAWNDTAPTCESDVKGGSNQRCDFEDPGICGWRQDERHDFDWERYNKKTPSSFLNTGPSYDHTLGEGGTGFYMYIESSSRRENATARLLSPVYDLSLTKNACFSFYYHMFGKHIGGLRVYQKPDSAPLAELSDEHKRSLLLFEKWGDQGDTWWGAIVNLTELTEDFQIVIEGIRGKKFTSDIAIDDVALLQGENCTKAELSLPTPPPVVLESCEGRCDSPMPTNGDCGCTDRCILIGNCCPDFLEMCIYNASQTEEQTTWTEAQPQTEELVSKTSPTTTTSTTTTSTTTTTTTTPKPSPPRVTLIVTKATETPKTTTELTVARTSTTQKTPQKPTIFQKDAISATNASSNPKPVGVSNVSTPRSVSTTTVVVPTKKYGPNTTVPVLVTLKAATLNIAPTEPPKKRSVDKKKMEIIQVSKQAQEKNKSSAWKPILITLAVVGCLVGAAWAARGARGARGRAALAALRGRTRHDPEVRYLNTDQEE